MTDAIPLVQEREALSQILSRLMSEESSLDNLCKHVPRVVSVAANVARIQSALAKAAEPDAAEIVMRALRELEQELEEEQSGW